VGRWSGITWDQPPVRSTILSPSPKGGKANLNTGGASGAPRAPLPWPHRARALTINGFICISLQRDCTCTACRAWEPGQTWDMPTGGLGQNSTHMQAVRRATREAPPRCSAAEAYYALEHVREAVVTLCPTSLWLELAANAYPCMSSFVDIGSNKGHTLVRAFLVCGRERQAAFEACTIGGNLHITAPKATVDIAGIVWRLIVHDWSIARRTRLLQRSCTLSRSTASMAAGPWSTTFARPPPDGFHFCERIGACTGVL
jgi:hypothetical protein